MNIKKNKFVQWIWQVLSPILPVEQIVGAIKFPAYIVDIAKYRAIGGEVEVKNLYPCLNDKTATTSIDWHYFYQAHWGLEKIYKSKVSKHVDIGSDVRLIGLLSVITDVYFIDIRPFNPKQKHFFSIESSISCLPLQTESITSLSCLSVAEHIGLGRYGDELDIDGTKKACSELERVLAKGGDLYFSLPIGEERVCFNAHRIFRTSTIKEFFPNLKLFELSVVNDSGQYAHNVNPDDYNNQRFTNGLFHFKK